MELHGVQTAAAHVVVADSIRRWIALGTLAPGDRLPPERQLAEQLGVGRLTVRQALRLLADEGLVVTQRGRSGGTFLLEERERPLRGIEVTEELLSAVRDNFDFRLGIEPQAARFAAERGEAMERWAIRGLAEGKAETYQAFRLHDSRFHIAIAEASHNSLILEAVSQSRAEFFRWADAAWERVNWSDLPPDERDFGLHHRPMAEAIEAREPEEAARRMADHLAQGKDQFLAAVRRPVAQPARLG